MKLFVYVLVISFIYNDVSVAIPISDADIHQDELLVTDEPMDKVEEPPQMDEQANYPEGSGDYTGTMPYGDDALPVESEEKPAFKGFIGERDEELNKDDAESSVGNEEPIEAKEEPIEEKEEPSEGKEEPNEGDEKPNSKVIKATNEHSTDKISILDKPVLDWSNKNITALSKDMFPDKLDNLKDLLLENNAISRIDRNVFASLPNLENINLSKNTITTLDPETFSGLDRLTDLDLSENELQLPSGRLFLNVPNLKKLSLAGCGLTQLPENTLDGMISLEDLDLQGNPISDNTPITPHVFAPLTYLTNLILPAGSSPALVAEVCRSHGLIHMICLDTCIKQSIPCLADAKSLPNFDGNSTTSVPDDEKVTYLIDVRLDVSEETAKNTESKIDMSGVGRMLGNAKDHPTTSDDKSSKTEENEKEIGEKDIEIGPVKTGGELSGAGVNKTVIGLIIGGMLAVVAGVVVKKNWNKITCKIEDANRRRTGAGAPRGLAAAAAEAGERVPEEEPLKCERP